MNSYLVTPRTGPATTVQADKFVVDHPDQVRFLLNGVDTAYFNGPMSVVLVVPFASDSAA